MNRPRRVKALVIGTDRDSSKNYMPKVLAAAARFPEGTSLDVEIRHDDDCPILHGKGYCACDPDVIATPIEDGKGGSHAG